MLCIEWKIEMLCLSSREHNIVLPAHHLRTTSTRKRFLIANRQPSGACLMTFWLLLTHCQVSSSNNNNNSRIGKKYTNQPTISFTKIAGAGETGNRVITKSVYLRRCISGMLTRRFGLLESAQKQTFIPSADRLWLKHILKHEKKSGDDDRAVLFGELKSKPIGLGTTNVITRPRGWEGTDDSWAALYEQ